MRKQSHNNTLTVTETTTITPGSIGSGVKRHSVESVSLSNRLTHKSGDESARGATKNRPIVNTAGYFPL